MTKALTRLRGCTGCYKLLAFTQQKHYVLTTFHNISKKHSHSAKWKRLDGEIQHVFFFADDRNFDMFCHAHVHV